MLRWLRAAFTLTLLCLSVFLGAVFATQNTISVSLTLGPWALGEQPMAVWLLSFLIVGVLLGSLMRWIPLNNVEISREKQEDLINFFETLEEDDDVQNVYHSMEE